MGVKWKILLIATAGPVILAAAMFLMEMRSISREADQAVLQEARGIVVIAEAARDMVALDIDQGIIRPFDQIPRDKLLEAVPVLAAIAMVQEKASQLGYQFRVPKEYPRNPRNEPTELERGVLRQLESRHLDEMIIKEPEQIRYFRAIRLTKECLYCHGEPKGAKDPVGGIKEGWKVGEVHGAFEIISSLAESREQTMNAAINAGLVTLVLLGCILALARYVISGILKRQEVAVLALADQEEKFRSLVETTDDWIWEMDALGRYTYVSPRAKDILGFDPEEVLGKSIADFKSPKDAQRFREILASMDTQRKGLRSVMSASMKKSGQLVLLETSFVPFFDAKGGLKGFRGIDRDITERVRLQESLTQSEKMASLGGLAAGMAHEINNPLSGISQSVQVIERRLTVPSPANDQAALEAGCPFESVIRFLEKRKIVNLLSGIRASVARAARIVENMLELSRRSDAAGKPADVGVILERAVELCSKDPDLNKDYNFNAIQIERDYASDLPKVPCVPAQIEQVVMNVLRNAAQALSETPREGFPSRIILRTSLAGESVRVDVEDNGPGIDEETRRRIFEPFFTTRAPGKGTGFGLSVSYFIITKIHDGEFLVASAVGQGTRISFTLPLSPPQRMNLLSEQNTP
jgi:PAS domain S-box-containing protein